jgi:hypothetical protein
MRTAIIILGILITCEARAGERQDSIVIENAYVRYTISPDARNLGFIDKKTGTDYLRHDTPSFCALVRRDGKEYPATFASFSGGRLVIRFDEAGAEAVLRVEPRNSYIRITVESVTDKKIDSLVFLNIPLTLKGRPEESFGACAFSLNLITRVDQLPALQTELRSSCYRKFGIAGAKAAIVGTPMEKILPALKEVLTEADEMPHCKVAGPWAREVPFNHGSYLFNFGTLTESTVDDWIGMARNLGVTQIDNHGGSAAFFRFGDFVLNREKWQEGWETYRWIVKRLHDAGIGSIFHTYGFFIDKQSKYVTPVPDKRLDAFRTFSLSDAIDPNAAEIRVDESTKDISTVTGFFEHNSIVLHIDDELVTFGGVTKESPWRFTGVKRGAFDTKISAHAKGAKARHLKECFGLFVPDAESSLFEEIAKNHADIVNACDFDGIYLDAIDGSSILRGPDECWYWADKFVFDIQKHLKKPVGMEMSAMWHHFWQFRTRWQAWDYPQRGHKRFIDIHADSANGGLLLPLHFGWWNFQAFNPPQVEPTYPDVIEYLGAKLIGWDAGISLTGAIDQKSLNAVPLFSRAVDILRTCEELRRAGSFDETTKAKLREPGKEFSLFYDSAGKWRFRPAHYDLHTAIPSEPGSLSWKTVNSFQDQPVKLRIEALMSTGSYEDSGNVILADLSEPNSFTGTPRAAEGVTVKLTSASTSSGQESAGVLTATNTGKVPRNAAWARLDRKFEPWLNLKNHQALGVWVEGDGLGEIIAIRLESPRHISFGAVADRYITVDFIGRRYFTLVETESVRWSDYVWNDGKWLYNVYRETIDFGAVESVSIWYNNLPQGSEVRCLVGKVKALPMVPCIVKNPAITVNGKTICFPVEIQSGCCLEFNGSDDCTLYGPKGQMIAKVVPKGEAPLLLKGENKVVFSCDQPVPSKVEGMAARVRVVVISHGEGL